MRHFTRYLPLAGLMLGMSSCSRYQDPSTGKEPGATSHQRTWSVDSSNNDQHLDVSMGDQIEVTLGHVGPWHSDEPEISGPSIQLEGRALQSPPSPGGPVYTYTLRATAAGESRFRQHSSDGSGRLDETFTITIKVAPVGTTSAGLDGSEPLLGSWVLSLEKSSFDPGHAPHSETRTFAAAPEGIKAETVVATSRGWYSSPSSIYERPGEIMTTDPETDRITRVGERKYRIEQLRSGKVLGRFMATVSPDDRLLTVRQSVAFGMFESRHDVRVFDRQ